MTRATYDMVRLEIEKMVAFPVGEGWHVPRDVADKALERLAAHEKEKWPVPKLWPFEDTDLALVWRVNGWSIYEWFSDEETHFNVRCSALEPAPEASAQRERGRKE